MDSQPSRNFAIPGPGTAETSMVVSGSGNASDRVEVGVNLRHTRRGNLVLHLVARMAPATC